MEPGFHPTWRPCGRNDDLSGTIVPGMETFVDFPEMETSAEYRKYAEECRTLAELAKTERTRSILLEMAMAWMKLADDVESKGPRPN
jgi:hypothetical protein